MEFLEDGAWTKRVHPGWAGVVGITAATLAKHGFVGPRGAYDGRFGLFASHLGKYFAQADLGLATENLGRSWQINEAQLGKDSTGVATALLALAYLYHEMGAYTKAEPIALRRLEARPIATLSIEAQERHERMERTHRDD